MKSGARVYSYMRFSDPRQARGGSADRQLQYASEWAKDHGLILDESLSMCDAGLSAYHQRHVKQGALGTFLQAVDDGRIPKGSVLIVEGLDRLSRAEPIQAQAQLAQIINAGITVVTASDGREYNREGLKAQPMDLVYSLLVMIRAHEESDTKSKRVRASIRRLCEGWIAGTYRGIIRNGRDPIWVRWSDEKWELIPERVAAVRRGLELYRQGIGAKRVARMMLDEGYELTDPGVLRAHIYRLVKMHALRGAKQLTTDGEQFLLEDYYPRLLSDAEFDDLQLLAGQRLRRRGKGSVPNIITGIGRTFCGYCGGAMVGQNTMTRPGKNGALLDSNRRMYCYADDHSVHCPVKAGCSVVPIERALLEYCSDQMNLTRLHEPCGEGQVLRDQAAAARRKVEETEQQLSRVTEALLADESGAAPLVFVRKARELEVLLKERQAELLQAERELATLANGSEPATAERWAALAEGVLELDPDAREQVRQLVMDTFERIVVYVYGVGATDKSSRNIDVLLISRTGQQRTIRIDRRSGAWVASEDWDW